MGRESKGGNVFILHWLGKVCEICNGQEEMTICQKVCINPESIVSSIVYTPPKSLHFYQAIHLLCMSTPLTLWIHSLSPSVWSFLWYTLKKLPILTSFLCYLWSGNSFPQPGSWYSHFLHISTPAEVGF